MASYTVKAGDTLSSIGASQGVDWKSITGYKSGNPNLIYPGEVLSWGGSNPTAATPSSAAPSSSNTGTPAPTSSAALTNELTAFDKAAQNPIDVYNSALENLGISDARTRVTNLRQSLIDNQNLLNNLSGNIQKRTANSLVTEAQRQRLYASEEAPITTAGNQLNQQFSAAQADKADITAQAEKQSALITEGQNAKRTALLDRLKLAIDNEQNIEKKRQWQAEYDRQKEADRLAQINKQIELDIARQNANTNSSNNTPKKATLEEGLNQLGTSFKQVGKNTARFYTGKNTWMTREQAANSLANATGVTYKEALNAIYKRYKTKEGK